MTRDIDKGEYSHGKGDADHGKGEQGKGYGKDGHGYGGGRGMGMMGGWHASTTHLLRHMLKHSTEIGLKDDQVANSKRCSSRSIRRRSRRKPTS